MTIKLSIVSTSGLTWDIEFPQGKESDALETMFRAIYYTSNITAIILVFVDGIQVEALDVESEKGIY